MNVNLLMSKQSIHPDYHTVYIVTPNGEKFETRSTFGSEGAIMSSPGNIMDLVKKDRGIRKVSNLSKFNNRFKDFLDARSEASTKINEN